MAVDVSREHVDTEFDRVGLDNDERRWAAPSAEFLGERAKDVKVLPSEVDAVDIERGVGGNS